MENEKRKRKSFTVKEKIETLDRIRSGVRQSQVAKDLGVNESTVRGWKNDEPKLRQMVVGMHENEGLMREKSKTSRRH